MPISVAEFTQGKAGSCAINSVIFVVVVLGTSPLFGSAFCLAEYSIPISKKHGGPVTVSLPYPPIQCTLWKLRTAGSSTQQQYAGKVSCSSDKETEGKWLTDENVVVEEAVCISKGIITGRVKNRALQSAYGLDTIPLS